MDSTTLEALEFPDVLRVIAGLTVTRPGRELVASLLPSPDPVCVEDAYRSFSEAASFIKESGRFPIAGTQDIRTILSGSFPAGAFFPAEDLLLIRDNIRVSVGLKALNKPAFKKRFPLLGGVFDAFSDLTGLSERLERTFDDKGVIVDDATAVLYDIRRSIRGVKGRAREVLDRFLREPKMREFLQEDIVTIRDDRFVLAVIAGKQAEVPGIIHGRSGSGATFFIEPVELVETNNKLSVLKKQEKAEEIEILKEITAEVLEVGAQLLTDLDVVAGLDLLQAKAIFSEQVSGTVPLVKRGGDIRFVQARHPLLVMKELGGGAAVVPVDIIISGDVRVAVISGANTGGKTVALKTLGLLTIMAASAIPVPAAEGSEAVCFKDVFADVGDRQDITASLSTFSAHVKRLCGFVAGAGAGSLVLMDEIGAGTEPSEAAALGLAALETLKKKGAVTAVTTHLNLIKAHAEVTPSYLNISVEFDEETFRPLYRLRYGLPGASFGLSIAEGLGMPQDLIALARTYISGNEGAFMKSIRAIEEEKEEISRIKERLKTLEEKRAEAVARLKAGRQELLKKMESRLNSQVERTLEDIRAITKEVTKGALGQGARRKVLEAASAAKERLNPVKVSGHTPAVGERVRIANSGAKGDVLRVDGANRRAELMVGNLKVWVDFKRLERMEQGTKGGAVLHGADIKTNIEPSSSVNLLGMRTEEAMKVVTRFIDNAHAGGLERVEIIHGMGTGALKKAVARFLKSNGVVKAFYPAAPSAGGAGVTVVELR